MFNRIVCHRYILHNMLTRFGEQGIFRKTIPQLSLFDIDNMYPNILPPKDWRRIYEYTAAELQ